MILEDPADMCLRDRVCYGVPVAAALIGVSVNVGNNVPGPGVTGVLVGGKVGVGVTMLTGMTNN